MSQSVTKVVGYAVIGPPTGVTASKVVGYVIYDTLSQSTPVAHARKKVTVRARLIPDAP